MESKGPIKDYLKYYRLARHYAKRKYGLSQDDMEMLFFLYSEVLFDITLFRQHERTFHGDKYRLKRLMDDGWIIEQPGIRRVRSRRIYALSLKAKNMVKKMYNILDGTVTMETNPQINPLFRANAKYRERQVGKEILKLNKSLKS